MPRFAFSDGPGPFGSPSPAPPPHVAARAPRSTYNAGGPSPSSMPPAAPSFSSVKLMCQSSDGRAVHALCFKAATGTCSVETRTLPLAGTYENDVRSADVQHYRLAGPSVVRTQLPGRVRDALLRYPPIELLCLGNSSTSHKSGAPKIPPLCLYTKKEVFLLHLTYDDYDFGSSSFSTDHPVEGACVRVEEPYEDYLVGYADCQIVRIRPAPQQYQGYTNVMNPPTAMAMLTCDTSTSDYCLCLFHGQKNGTEYGVGRSVGGSIGTGNLTTKHLAMEDLYDPGHNVVDFCFCQSGGGAGGGLDNLQVLSCLTVALLKSNGVALHVSPVLFRGTVVPAAMLVQTLDFLSAFMQDAPPNSARWRQCKTARQYLVEAFPDVGSAGKTSSLGFVTAQTGRSVSYDWPIRLQGLFHSERSWDDSGAAAAAVIEPFAAGQLAGFTIGYADDLVDFCVASPSTFIPRFTYESPDDTDALDSTSVFGAVVNRVDLRNDDSAAENLALSGMAPKPDQIQLIRDPVMDTIVHYVTPSRIISISTTAARLSANKAQEVSRQQQQDGSVGNPLFSPTSKRGNLPSKTTAWMSLDVAFFQGDVNPIVGAAISSNVQLGHALVARLADGNTLAVNLTETRHLREMERLSEADGASPQLLTNMQDGDLLDPSVRHSQPLSEIVQPSIRAVMRGLSKMVQIGGSSTPQDQVTPDILAGCQAIQQRCRKDVVLPLQEMQTQVSVRKKELEVTCNRYNEQLKQLEAMIVQLKMREQHIRERANVVTENATVLAQRCASALQSSSDLLPTLTQAEYDYFQEVKRMDLKTKDYETEAELLKVKSLSLKEAAESSGPGQDPLMLKREILANTKGVLQGTEVLLGKNESSLKQLRREMEDLAEVAGMEQR